MTPGPTTVTGAIHGEDLDDSSFGRTIIFGAIVGIPVTFMLLFAAMLLATDQPGVAPAMAWTAIVGGGYFGGFVALNVALAELERRDRSEVVAIRPAPPVEARHAA